MISLQLANGIRRFLVLLATTLLMAAAANAQPRATVTRAVKQDVSPPLRSIQPILPASAGLSFTRVHIVKLNPKRKSPAAAAGLAAPDPSLQESPGPKIDMEVVRNFDGLGDGTPGFAIEGVPPDTVGAVGDTQFVQWVNTSFAIFDKATGKMVYGPALGNTIWKGFKGACANSNDGDPIVLYDKEAKRWVMAQFSVNDSSGFFQCVAVSTSSDATGSYRRFQFKYKDFDDYPKMGVWPDGYYVSFNMFQGQNFIGSNVCAYDREAMLGRINRPVRQQCFQLASNTFGLLPSDMDGSTPPPAGSPNYFVALNENSLDLWKFHINWTDTTRTTFGSGADQAADATIPVAPYRMACGGENCIAQADTTTQLDSLGERLMYRLAYRNFGTRESLVVNHAVQTDSGRIGVRWYEIGSPNTAPTLAQQGTFAPDSQHRWMGSVAMDKAGNLALGYSVSGSAMHPAIRFAARTPGLPAHLLGAETSIFEGIGSQSDITRWGDYSALTVDPTDDCTLWFTTEYHGTSAWKTRVAAIKLSSCH